MKTGQDLPLIIQLALDEYKKTSNILALAKVLKDNYTITQSLRILSRITKYPIYDIMEIASWDYYGGDKNDLEMNQIIESWGESYWKKHPEFKKLIN